MHIYMLVPVSFSVFTFMRHSILDIIAFGRVRRVVIGGYVAGKNLDWYLGHKYAHNAYNCTRRSRETYTKITLEMNIWRFCMH